MVDTMAFECFTRGNSIPQDSTATGRIGRKIMVKFIKYRYRIFVQASSNIRHKFQLRIVTAFRRNMRLTPTN